MKKIILLIGGILCALNVVSAELKLTGIKCGQITCRSHEYCSEHDRQCRPCEQVCNTSNHNFDEELCVRDCQDYIHDVKYVQIGASSGGVNNSDSYGFAALILAILNSIVIFTFGCYKLYKWAKNKEISVESIKKLFNKNHNEPKSPPTDLVISNTKSDLRINIPTTRTQSELSPVTMSTSISRRPAEDSALDYAYDNRGMADTPSPQDPSKSSSRF